MQKNHLRFKAEASKIGGFCFKCTSKKIPCNLTSGINNYLRFKMVDKDGNREYTMVRALRCDNVCRSSSGRTLQNHEWPGEWPAPRNIGQGSRATVYPKNKVDTKIKIVEEDKLLSKF